MFSAQRLQMESLGEAWTDFKDTSIEGTLYSVGVMSDQETEAVERYLEATMPKDLRYIRCMYGYLNPDDRKEFTYFWESPFVEEHVQDTRKRRRMEQRLRNTGVRKLAEKGPQDDPDGYLNDLEKGIKWSEKQDAAEPVKTVSRVIQSFEKTAVRSMLSYTTLVPGGSTAEHAMLALVSNTGDVDTACHTLRRCDATYDLFAKLVVSELHLQEGLSASKNISIFATKTLIQARNAALERMITCLESLPPMQRDTVGIPIMNINRNVIVGKQTILCVNQEDQAIFILQVAGGALTAEKIKDLKTIHVLQVVAESETKSQKASDPTIMDSILSQTHHSRSLRPPATARE